MRNILVGQSRKYQKLEKNDKVKYLLTTYIVMQ